ncbi:aspartyl-phosphate phosphatase Spo0E family protein [Paenibacillus sp. CMAA1739]|uniref:aspartyl-phosphate phosphatase Spo0E family protein n=1 Tax=Paenibacillus ottowii TaxID=2315729 RepID=UPI002730ED37|nr:MULTISPECIES: aspartyl-phosphate phosphatase Spo0E family protein [Paenibacillus]MDP1510181.1 aspartyl-phosphate phosphatase Spo0E family protein [Paenibacillus ottowii]MEC4565597.1 aspartyl-phosphate phosphatase Spo0E family protein [Paenibacillus sp. CMAA1739]
MKWQELEECIEEKRKELNDLAKEVGLKDRRVLTKSMELDRLLNKYSDWKYSYRRQQSVSQGSQIQEKQHELVLSY